MTEKTSFTSDLQKALGSNLVKTRVGMTPHTLMSEVLEIVEECRQLKADCIVTLGGGSLSDAAKVITFVSPPFLEFFPSLISFRLSQTMSIHKQS